MRAARPVASLLVLVACGAGACGESASPVRHVGNAPRLAFRELGEGPTVVVLHGGPGVSHDYLRPEWDALAADHRLVYYDQRGCGRSDPADSYRAEDHVADLHGLLAEVSPDRPVYLAGVSWGSVLALLYARAHPERVAGLVLSGVPSFENLRKWANAVAAHDADTTRWGAGVDPHEHGVDPTYSNRVRLCRRALFSTIASLGSLPELDELRSLGTPTLLLQGSFEVWPRTDAGPLWSTLSRAERRVIEGAGHSPWYNRPHVFFCELRRFIADGVREGRPPLAPEGCEGEGPPREAGLGIDPPRRGADGRPPTKLRPFRSADLTAGEWLRLLDDDRHDEAFAAAGAELRARFTPETWRDTIRALRDLLGGPMSRRHMPGYLDRESRRVAPDGYATRTYWTVFSRPAAGRDRVTVARERVVLARNADGRVVVVGYHVSLVP